MGGGGVITKLDYFRGPFLYILGLFLTVKVPILNYFGVLLI